MAKTLKPITLNQAKKALEWVVIVLGVEDWHLRILVQDESPPWAPKVAGCGATTWDRPYKKATIWVSNEESIKDGHDPFSTLFHEFMHVVAGDLDWDDQAKDPVEFLWNRLGDFFARAYRAGTR